MRALVITVTADEVEMASDALWALGVVAIEERVGPHGTIELWTSLGDEIGYDDIGLPTRWPWRLEDVDEAVSETWREFAEPIWVDSDLVVQPRWIEFDPPTGVTVLKIDPGVTFGMGDHPTTMLSLRALRRELTPGDRVLDVGCGSGVLAIAAMKFGAGSATAIDIAPAAVPVTLPTRPPTMWRWRSARPRWPRSPATSRSWWPTSSPPPWWRSPLICAGCSPPEARL